MGFLTDAYDLFIIGVVSTILKPLWHLSALEISLLSSTALLSAAVGKVGAFIGAFLFPLMLGSPAFRLPGAMGVAAVVALGGFFITFLLPEPDTKSLETIEEEGERMNEKMEEETKI